MGAPDLFGSDPESIAKMWNQLQEAFRRIEALEAAAAKKAPKAKPEGGKTNCVWERYSAAFERRYHAKPMRNAKVNGLLSQLIARVGEELAPEVAEFYVFRMSSAFYTQRMHPIDMLVRDAETVCAAMQRGRGVTVTEAHLGDQTAQRGDVWSNVAARMGVSIAARPDDRS